LGNALNTILAPLGALGKGIEGQYTGTKVSLLGTGCRWPILDRKSRSLWELDSTKRNPVYEKFLSWRVRR